MQSSRATGLFLTSAALALAVALPAAADLPPSPWVVRDIGVVARAGSTDVDANDVWTIKGSNGDPFSDADGFHLASLAVSGDATLSARFLIGQASGDE